MFLIVLLKKGGIIIDLEKSISYERMDLNNPKWSKWQNKILPNYINTGSYFPRVIKTLRSKSKKTAVSDKKTSLNMPVIVKHFPWESMFRGGDDVVDSKQEKNVMRVRHEAWHEWIDSHLWFETCGKKHPKEIFLEIIDYIQGVKECTDKEAGLLYTIVGFNWRKKRLEAIISIFNQFMPDELYELVKPFYEAFEME